MYPSDSELAAFAQGKWHLMSQERWDELEIQISHDAALQAWVDRHRQRIPRDPDGFGGVAYEQPRYVTLPLRRVRIFSTLLTIGLILLLVGTFSKLVMISVFGLCFLLPVTVEFIFLGLEADPEQSSDDLRVPTNTQLH